VQAIFPSFRWRLDNLTFAHLVSHVSVAGQSVSDAKPPARLQKAERTDERREEKKKPSFTLTSCDPESYGQENANDRADPTADQAMTALEAAEVSNPRDILAAG